jgi:hypothetical protein
VPPTPAGPRFFLVFRRKRATCEHPAKSLLIREIEDNLADALIRLELAVSGRNFPRRKNLTDYGAHKPAYDQR